MATKASVVADARKRLRDFPKFFQVSFPPAGRTYNVGKPNVDADSLWVAYVPNDLGASVTILTDSDYSLDARGGNLRLATLPDASSILVEGNYYEWLLPEDLEFAADLAIHEILHGQQDLSLATLSPAVADVVSLLTVIEALHNLLNEYARDIDVIAGESVHIQANQRYRMVADLLARWEAEYEDKAAALNIGIDRMEIFTLRRISRTTERYVPIYKAREVGDFDPPQRIFPPVPDGDLNLTDEEEDRVTVLVDGNPPPSQVIPGTYS